MTKTGSVKCQKNCNHYIMILNNSVSFIRPCDLKKSFLKSFQLLNAIFPPQRNNWRGDCGQEKQTLRLRELALFPYTSLIYRIQEKCFKKSTLQLRASMFTQGKNVNFFNEIELDSPTSLLL